MTLASTLRRDQANQKPSAATLHGHFALTRENQGNTPWCGPAALALATGQSYAATCALLRTVAPTWYEPEGPIVTAYWRDLLSGLDRLGIAHADVALPERQQTLLALVRCGLLVGWYLLRVTDHFLLLRSHDFGFATLHDNLHTGALVTSHTYGRRHVTHATRLLGGPLAEPPGNGGGDGIETPGTVTQQTSPLS